MTDSIPAGPRPPLPRHFGLIDGVAALVVVADLAYRRSEKPVGRVLRKRLSHAGS